ncbi:MAG: hypothetical protein V2I43_25380 [Parvularcula sp.]|jgi:hypothetical protein|nr:hypothetical protein [Parvularcula sp.]
MKFKLYRCRIKRADGEAIAFVVAPNDERATDVIIEIEAQFSEDNEGFELERIDDHLPPSQRIGLDALLEMAPVGLASYSDAIGWVPHAIPAPKLRLWRVEAVDGAEAHFVIAPTPDLASAIFCSTLELGQNGPRTICIHDGAEGLGEEKLRGLAAMLEYGDVGLVEWDDDKGWQMIDDGLAS